MTNQQESKIRFVDESEIGFTPHKAAPQISMRIPVLLITPIAYQKMALYVAHTKGEVGWMGYCTKNEDDDLILHDVFLPRQQAAYDTCELTAAGLTEMANDIFANYPEEEAMEICNNLAFWGHSHGLGDTHPSQQDVKQLYSFMKTGYEWFVSAIANQHGMIRCTYIDFAHEIEISDIPWRMYLPSHENLANSVMKAIKAKIAPMPTRVAPAPTEQQKSKGGRNAKANRNAAPTGSTSNVVALAPGITILSNAAFAQLTKEDLQELNKMEYMPAMDYLQTKTQCQNLEKYHLWLWCKENPELVNGPASAGELRALAADVADSCAIGETQFTRDYKDNDDKQGTIVTID